MRTALALLTMATVAAAQDDFKFENKADNLKALMHRLTKAIAEGDDKTSLSITKALFLDEARLKKALKDDAPKETVDKLVAMHADFLKTDDAKLARALSPGDPKRTEIQVHAATTEEVARYEKDSIAWKEFPGGAKKLAETVLRPGVTFYEVEILEPGKDSGMKFHLFFWDGEKWSMLGPAWRVLPK